MLPSARLIWVSQIARLDGLKQDDELLLIAAGSLESVSRSLDRVRQFVAQRLGDVPVGQHNFLWVTDFPLLAFNSDSGRHEARNISFVSCLSDWRASPGCSSPFYSTAPRGLAFRKTDTSSCPGL